MTAPAAAPRAPAIVATLTAGLLALYTAVHEPTGRDLVLVGFDSVDAWKAAFATTAVVVLAAHLGSGVTIARATARSVAVPDWYPEVHALLGSVGIALSIPVVFHDVWSLGFAGTGAESFHVAAACATCGLAAGDQVIRSRRQPRIAVTVALVATSVVWWLSGDWWRA
ncbi:MAG: DUF6529 family protein [Actinomycetota bacterium]